MSRNTSNDSSIFLPRPGTITPEMLKNQFLDNVVVVKTADQLVNLQNSTIYLIDGVIDMKGQSINVPSGFVQIRGFSANISEIRTTTPNSTLFVGGGDLFISDLKLVAGGEGTKMFNMVDPAGALGLAAVEFFSVNFEDSKSLGTLKHFRQGLMFNCAIFGTEEGLTFAGKWRGGWRVQTSIVRGFGKTVNGITTGTLFGAINVAQNHPDFLVFEGRFISDCNTQLVGSCIGYKFTEANFVERPSFILEGGFYTGTGTYVQGIDHLNVKSRWKRNKGLKSTYPGVILTVLDEMITPVTGINIFTQLICEDCPLQDPTWFIKSTNLAMKYIGSDQLSISIQGVLNIVAANNNQIEIQTRVFRAATGLTEISSSHKATTNGGASGDRAENFGFIDVVFINENDIIQFWVANTTSSSSVKITPGGSIMISARE